MKNFIKPFLVGMLLIGSTISCTDSELPIDVLYETVDTDSGVILRFTTPPAPIVNISGNAPFSNVIETVFEVQKGNGTVQADFQEVRMYISLFSNNDLDEPVLNTDGTEFTEVLFETISSAQFDTISSNGLPSFSMSLPTQGILDRYIDVDFPPTTFIRFRYELELTNGMVIDESSTGASLEGGFFESPFFYKIRFRTTG